MTSAMAAANKYVSPADNSVSLLALRRENAEWEENKKSKTKSKQKKPVLPTPREQIEAPHRVQKAAHLPAGAVDVKVLDRAGEGFKSILLHCHSVEQRIDNLRMFTEEYNGVWVDYNAYVYFSRMFEALVSLANFVVSLESSDRNLICGRVSR